jgi:hypothetical protein
MAVARKKTPRKKADGAKGSVADRAWRQRYQDAQEEIDQLKIERAQIQQSLDAVIESRFGIEWPAKVEELGSDVTDQLRLILTTAKGEGRTRLMFNEAVRLAQLEDGPDFVAIVAAQPAHRKFLQEYFHEHTGSKTSGSHREALHGTRVHFVTADEDRANALRGLSGVVRLFDHYTVESTLVRLLRK